MSCSRPLAVVSLLAALGLLAAGALFDLSSASAAPVRQLRGDPPSPAENATDRSGQPDNASRQDPEGVEPLVDPASANATAAALLGRAGTPSGEEMAAVNASAVELALTGKASSPLCDQAPEGQTCVPNPHGHSNTYIYCSAHRLISPSPTSCESRMGRMSWCVGGGIGLTHDYCDDPFCRNGGAYAGNGFYCHNNNVVQCEGQNAPRVVEACSDTSFQRGCCHVTRHYRCAGYHPNPFCEVSGVSEDCSGCPDHGHWDR